MVQRPGLLFLIAALALAGALLYRSQKTGSVLRVSASPKSGFWASYFLYIPRAVSNEAVRPLLVVPINTGNVSDDAQSVETYARERLLPRVKHLADTLRTPLLIPAFLRPANRPGLYTHALDRDSLTTEAEDLRRVDLQLIAMMDDAAARLSKRGLRVGKKAVFYGFSASGMFANRFTVLHPDRVLAAAVGSPGGWPIAPVDEWQGAALPYPVGVADLEQLTGRPFDIRTFRRIPLFFFMGEQDDNDSVPYEDGYDPEHASLVFELFGDSPISRWRESKAIYESVGANARFVTYKGAGHAVTTEMKRDLLAFFRESLGK